MEQQQQTIKSGYEQMVAERDDRAEYVAWCADHAARWGRWAVEEAERLAGWEPSGWDLVAQPEADVLDIVWRRGRQRARLQVTLGCHATDAPRVLSRVRVSLGRRVIEDYGWVAAMPPHHLFGLQTIVTRALVGLDTEKP